MNREDFPLINDDFIYFDNAATTIKPKKVINSITNYYESIGSNIHRGDYKNSILASNLVLEAREEIKKFINAKDQREIVFTSGTTHSLNILANHFSKILTKDDEILLTKLEHASNVLPWFNTKAAVKYIPLDDNHLVTLSNFKSVITKNTKIVSIAIATNTLGDYRPVKEIIKYCHQNNIIVILDAAQYVAHQKLDVQELDADFICFSGHKLYGPFGIGVLYGKYTLLDQIIPLLTGGDMNSTYSDNKEYLYHNLPSKLEAGTLNITGIIGLKAAIEYINKIGLKNIHKHEILLQKYLIEKLSNNPNIIIYNKNIQGNIVLFNYKDIFAQDLAIYLDKYNIAIRSGNHCSKLSNDIFKVKNTCRISFGLYNTYDEIDKLVKVLNNKNIMKEII